MKNTRFVVIALAASILLASISTWLLCRSPERKELQGWHDIGLSNDDVFRGIVSSEDVKEVRLSPRLSKWYTGFAPVTTNGRIYWQIVVYTIGSGDKVIQAGFYAFPIGSAEQNKALTVKWLEIMDQFNENVIPDLLDHLRRAKRLEIENGIASDTTVGKLRIQEVLSKHGFLATRVGHKDDLFIQVGSVFNGLPGSWGPP